MLNHKQTFFQYIQLKYLFIFFDIQSNCDENSARIQNVHKIMILI